MIRPDYEPETPSNGPVSFVFSALDAIRKRICDLTHSVAAMEDKLQPALRPEPVQMTGVSPGNAAQPPTVESELVSQLREQERALEQLICRLNNLRARVEI